MGMSQIGLIDETLIGSMEIWIEPYRDGAVAPAPARVQQHFWQFKDEMESVR